MTYKAVIIGAGPIGVEMATVFKRSGTNYLHLEAGPIGSTITKWPRNTRFFSSPEWIAISGVPIHNEGQEIITGEHYLSYLRHVVEIFDLRINTYEQVTSVSGQRGDFTLQTEDLAGETQTYHAEHIVLATGDMNRPRTIGVPGEDLPHVTHYWQDPHLYFQRKLLIVGGRNSAVEAAIRCWRAGVNVSISYRGKGLDEKRLISRLHLEIDLLIRNGQITFYPESEVSRIEPGSVQLTPIANPEDENEQLPHRVAADFVYLATGFEMDQTLYRAVGVSLEGEEQQPVHNPVTMESNIPGVYVIGTATGGNQRGYKVFITTSHEHCTRTARDILPATEVRDEWVGNYASRDYPLSSKDVE
jgi:thioredoxin reductase (NADPH)